MNIAEFKDFIEEKWGPFVSAGFRATGSVFENDVTILDLKDSYEFIGEFGDRPHLQYRWGDWRETVGTTMGETNPLIYKSDDLRRFLKIHENWREARSYVCEFAKAYFPSNDVIIERFGSPPDWTRDTWHYKKQRLVEERLLWEPRPPMHPLVEFEYSMITHVSQMIWGDLVGASPGFSRLRGIVEAGGIPIGAIEEEFDSEEDWWEQELVVCWVHEERPPTPWEADELTRR